MQGSVVDLQQTASMASAYVKAKTIAHSQKGGFCSQISGGG